MAQGFVFAGIAVLFCFFVLCVEGKPAIIRDANVAPEIACKLPAAKGHCRAILPRWMYNAEKGTCQEFDFGGCDGNANNFLTFKACMATCSGVTK